MESLAISYDEEILFSGGLDGKIGVWNVHNSTLLGNLITDFPIRTLHLSDDNDYLVAESKASNRENRRLMFWTLEKNDDAFRINVDMKGVNSCYVTPQNTYMALMDKKKVDIWNIQSRTLA